MRKSFLVLTVASAVYAYLLQYQFTAETQWRPVIKVHENDPKASLEMGYNILVDFESYTKWNTFTYRVERLDDEYAMVFVRLKQPFFADKYSDLSLKFKFVEMSRNERICWSYQMMPEYLQPWILRTRRCMEIKLDADAQYVLLRHYDVNMGPLSPVVEWLYKSSIEAGFEQMTNDFLKYAQS